MGLLLNMLRSHYKFTHNIAKQHSVRDKIRGDKFSRIRIFKIRI
jgi:hypothetical protein